MGESQFDLVVHATHEAGFKIGGVGATLAGVLASPAYRAAVARTILVGPMNTVSPTEMARLTAPDNGLEIIYSSWHRVDEAPAEVSAGLREIEARYRVRLLYGRRTFLRPEEGGGPYQHEVLLVDARWADVAETNAFKLLLWHHYRFASDRYEWLYEFDLVIKAAEPSFAALRLIAGGGETGAGSRYLIAHEWMGIPLALCAQLHQPERWRLIYYAHEMPTARTLVENHPGHDTRFYNVLQQAQAAGMTMEELFGEWGGFFKHALLQRVVHMDSILVIGSWVEQELRFMGGPFAAANMDLVYNGLVYQEIDLEERAVSSVRLQQYCQNLLGFRPDYLFTHVTRMVLSKAIWRDLSVLQHLDGLLAQDGKTAVFYLLSSAEPAGRSPEEVLRWEREYGWPVVHQADNGDLLGHEVPLYRAIERFNARSMAIKIVFVNQFGWNQEQCGSKMPADMTLGDLRRGTDLEFGQSIYEPFGIAQLEPLMFGALSVVSTVCGCVGFAEGATQKVGLSHFTNLLQADYVTLRGGLSVYTPWDALEIGLDERDRLERANAYNVALAVRATLPTTVKQAHALLRWGQQVSHKMSWEVVVQDYLIPALKRAG
jgi:hypothetical protein